MPASPATGAAFASTRSIIAARRRGRAWCSVSTAVAPARASPIAWRRPSVAETVRYLRAREQVNGVYREAHVPIDLIEGPRREVRALTYIVERAHPSYAGRLPLALQARLIRAGSGLSGNNLDYLISTLRHLAELGIRERELERLLALIGPHTARCGTAGHASPYVAGLLRAARTRPPAVRRTLRPAELRRFLHRLHLQ